MRGGAGNSNWVPSTQSLSNRSLASNSTAAILRSNVADLEQQHCPERTGIQRQGAVLSVNFGRQGRPEILPRRLHRRGGASVVRRNAAKPAVAPEGELTSYHLLSEHNAVGAGGN